MTERHGHSLDSLHEFIEVEELLDSAMRVVSQGAESPLQGRDKVAEFRGGLRVIRGLIQGKNPQQIVDDMVAGNEAIESMQGEIEAMQMGDRPMFPTWNTHGL